MMVTDSTGVKARSIYALDLHHDFGSLLVEELHKAARVQESRDLCSRSCLVGYQNCRTETMKQNGLCGSEESRIYEKGNRWRAENY